MTQIGEWLSERFDDVVNVEVNTIVGGITGRKPPAWPAILKEIAENYALYLDGFYGTEADPHPFKIDPAQDWRPQFEAISQAAKTLLATRSPQTVSGRSECVILFRIRRHCGALIELMARTPAANAPNDAGGLPEKLSGEDATLVRKIWELGTNTVVLQTVMQLDGDMVNRVALRPEHDGDLLYRIHNESVNRSFRYWEMVARLVASFVTGRPIERL